MAKLNPRERRFVKRYVETGVAAEAARTAFNPTTDASAAQLGHAVLKRAGVQAAVAALLDAEGISDARLREIHANLLALYADPDPRNKAIALRALDMAYKLTGKYAPEKHEHTVWLESMSMAECEHFARTGEWPARLRQGAIDVPALPAPVQS